MKAGADKPMRHKASSTKFLMPVAARTRAVEDTVTCHALHIEALFLDCKARRTAMGDPLLVQSHCICLALVDRLILW